MHEFKLLIRHFSWEIAEIRAQGSTANL